MGAGVEKLLKPLNMPGNCGNYILGGEGRRGWGWRDRGGNCAILVKSRIKFLAQGT